MQGFNGTFYGKGNQIAVILWCRLVSVGIRGAA